MFKKTILTAITLSTSLLFTTTVAATELSPTPDNQQATTTNAAPVPSNPSDHQDTPKQPMDGTAANNAEQHKRLMERAAGKIKKQPGTNKTAGHPKKS